MGSRKEGYYSLGPDWDYLLLDVMSKEEYNSILKNYIWDLVPIPVKKSVI
jgi:hypothetical protein